CGIGNSRSRGWNRYCSCLIHSYHVIALTILNPLVSDEIDSYMYQTVGQDGVHLVAEALRLPLYRQTITGTPLELGSEYGSRSCKGLMKGIEGDETEDMYNLLNQVKVWLTVWISNRCIFTLSTALQCHATILTIIAAFYSPRNHCCFGWCYLIQLPTCSSGVCVGDREFFASKPTPSELTLDKLAAATVSI
ncbi:hypothetical protein MJO28_009804, partial [Puccinia striiformis f. sp. tritici]